MVTFQITLLEIENRRKGAKYNLLGQYVEENSSLTSYIDCTLQVKKYYLSTRRDI